MKYLLLIALILMAYDGRSQEDIYGRGEFKIINKQGPFKIAHNLTPGSKKEPPSYLLFVEEKDTIVTAYEPTKNSFDWYSSRKKVGLDTIRLRRFYFKECGKCEKKYISLFEVTTIGEKKGFYEIYPHGR